MDVLLSVKQIKNVKNIYFIIFFTDIVRNILCGIFVLTAVTPAMSACFIFLHGQFVDQGLFKESLHLHRTKSSKSAGAAGFSVYTR